jgi:hypothetical protein
VGVNTKVVQRVVGVPATTLRSPKPCSHADLLARSLHGGGLMSGKSSEDERSSIRSSLAQGKEVYLVLYP